MPKRRGIAVTLSLILLAIGLWRGEELWLALTTQTGYVDFDGPSPDALIEVRIPRFGDKIALPGPSRSWFRENGYLSQRSIRSDKLIRCMDDLLDSSWREQRQVRVVSGESRCERRRRGSGESFRSLSRPLPGSGWISPMTSGGIRYPARERSSRSRWIAERFDR